MIQPGDPFPDFDLAGVSTSSLRTKGPLVVFVWRIGCSTSRLALPFFGRLAHAYPGARVVAVGQDSSEALDDYLDATGQTIESWPDGDLSASSALGVEVLPSWILTDAGGKVLDAGVAWNRDRLEDLSLRLAAMTGSRHAQIVRDEDGVPLFKPG